MFPDFVLLQAEGRGGAEEAAGGPGAAGEGGSAGRGGEGEAGGGEEEQGGRGATAEGAEMEGHAGSAGQRGGTHQPAFIQLCLLFCLENRILCVCKQLSGCAEMVLIYVL